MSQQQSVDRDDPRFAALLEGDELDERADPALTPEARTAMAQRFGVTPPSATPAAPTAPAAPAAPSAPAQPAQGVTPATPSSSDTGGGEDAASPFLLPPLPDLPADAQSFDRAFVEGLHSSAKELREEVEPILEALDEGNISRAEELEEALRYYQLMQSVDGQSFLAISLLRSMGLSDDEIGRAFADQQGQVSGTIPTGPAPTTPAAPTTPGAQPPAAPSADAATAAGLTAEQVQAIIAGELQSKVLAPLAASRTEAALNSAADVVNRVLDAENVPKGSMAEETLYGLIDKRLTPNDLDPKRIEKVTKRVVREFRRQFPGTLPDAGAAPAATTDATAPAAPAAPAIPTPLSGGAGVAPVSAPAEPTTEAGYRQRMRERLLAKLAPGRT
jgi:hypothetical protein